MTVVLCQCRHRGLVDGQRLRRLRQALRASAHRLVEVADLCAVAATGDAALAQVLQAPSVVLCGCHERALRSLAARLAGRPLPALRCLDLRDPAAPEPAQALGLPDPPDDTAGASGPADTPGLPGAGDDAWYPLIDLERCVHCGQCQSFCLFGVYTRTAAGTVTVTQPRQCKTDCPACARVCPENAVIFPKCPDEAINGAALTAEQLAGARIRLEPSQVFGGDLRARLAARRAAAAAGAGAPPALFRPGAFPAPAADRTAADRPGGPAL